MLLKRCEFGRFITNLKPQEVVYFILNQQVDACLLYNGRCLNSVHALLCAVNEPDSSDIKMSKIN